MPISDADLLYVVRKLRQYLSSLDNSNYILGIMDSIDDVNVEMLTVETLPLLSQSSSRLSQLLKQIESTRAYRNMLKNFNMEEDTDGGE